MAANSNWLLQTGHSKVKKAEEFLENGQMVVMFHPKIIFPSTGF
jgi:hypothetical protein